MEFPIYIESGFRGRKAAYIKNPDKYTDAYHVDYRGGADMTVRRGGAQGPIVGRVDFHSFSSAIDISFENNQRVEMRKDGLFSKTRVVDLPAAPSSKRFSWKSTSFGGGPKMLDSSGQELAFFDRSRGVSKAGTLTLLVSGLEQQFMDQIFVSFMAVEEQLRRQRRAAAAGAAGGAAGGGGGGGC
ncbi:hypothetical protein BDV96DRAFT_577179 [Lophiotrema nucula]|uniref:DUF6593 domain-containing protein n=1 Tax=Lophiotrema nucula TaxID=690887 RepID=A0A6A5Z592_9PLEO|nr:hypothetical protein BDV96DRAFT_577179 [Lophiotrema nucula]